MEIACLLNTHKDLDLTKDTADSINVWMTDKIMVIVDGAGWHHFENSNFPYPLYRGLVHGRNASPFRNVLYGLIELCKRFDADWYCYLESDCLVVSSGFKEDLRRNKSKWIGGTNHRVDQAANIPVLNEIIGGQVDKWHYFLGAVQFFSRDYVMTLMSNKVPEKLIEATNNIPSGEFPGFHEYAFEEQLFVTLANYYKPNSYFNLPQSTYNVRFEPEVKAMEVTPGASIIHPLKIFNSPVRQHFRKFRDRLKNDRCTTHNRI